LHNQTNNIDQNIMLMAFLVLSAPILQYSMVDFHNKGEIA